MLYSPQEHTELTPQHYTNLIATGYRYMEFLGYLDSEEAVGMMFLLFKPLRLKPEGLELLEIDAPMIRNMVHNNPGAAIFIEKDY